FENVEVRMPAGRMPDKGGPGLEAGMRHGQQNALAIRLKLEHDVTGVIPCNDKLSRCIDRNHFALHPMLLRYVIRAATGWLRCEFVISPDQLERRAFDQFDIARSHPQFS